MKKVKGILKYIAKVISITLLIIVVIFGLFLLYVFVSTKIADSKGEMPKINLYTIISPSMTPNINVYDVVVTVKEDTASLKKGDVITFYSDNPNLNGYTITHRIIEIFKNGESYSFQTKGDYNSSPDPTVVPQEKVVGKVAFKIPQLGHVQFFLASKGGWILAILIPALAIIAYDIYKIIKLIMIKQKITEFKNDEELSQNKEKVDSIMSSMDMNKDNIINQENAKEEAKNEVNQSQINVQTSMINTTENLIDKDSINVNNIDSSKEEVITDEKLDNTYEQVEEKTNIIENNDIIKNEETEVIADNKNALGDMQTDEVEIKEEISDVQNKFEKIENDIKKTITTETENINLINPALETEINDVVSISDDNNTHEIPTVDEINISTDSQVKDVELELKPSESVENSIPVDDEPIEEIISIPDDEE